MNGHAARLIRGVALGISVFLLAVPSAVAAPGPGPAKTDLNPRPAVVPALQQWEGGTGSFELRKHSRIVLAKKQVDELDD